MNAIAKDGILFFGLEERRLAECLITWFSHLIGKQIIVKLELTIVFEEFSFIIVEKALFQLLNISVCELLMDFRVICIYAIILKKLKHF